MTRLERKSLTLDLLVLHNITLKQIIQSIDLCMTEHDDTLSDFQYDPAAQVQVRVGSIIHRNILIVYYYYYKFVLTDVFSNGLPDWVFIADCDLWELELISLNHLDVSCRGEAEVELDSIVDLVDRKSESEGDQGRPTQPPNQGLVSVGDVPQTDHRKFSSERINFVFQDFGFGQDHCWVRGPVTSFVTPHLLETLLHFVR